MVEPNKLDSKYINYRECASKTRDSKCQKRDKYSNLCFSCREKTIAPKSLIEFIRNNIIK